MKQTHPVDPTLGAWLDALPPGTWLRVPVHIAWTPLGITRVTVSGDDALVLSLDQGALGVPLVERLLPVDDGKVLLEGTWGPLVPMPFSAARTLAVRRVVCPLVPGRPRVVSVIQVE